MLWTGSSPLTVVRDSMWGFLMFAGVAWLAIAWSVLRLEPADVVGVAVPMILFGALCEAVRALAGTRTWWLNAGMAALFTATAVVLLAVPDSSFTAPAALAGWFLMVRGSVDVAVSTMNRGVDRTWGLMTALGVVQAGLGFFATGPLSRSGDLVIVTLGGLALLRAMADLVTSLRLREVSAVRHDVLHLPPEREAGVAGYAAGRQDFEETPSRPRHRAAGPTHSFHDEVVRTTADLDAKIAQAGVTGSGGSAHRVPHVLPSAPDTPEGVADHAGDASMITGQERAH
jgi:hypothetical protein